MEEESRIVFEDLGIEFNDSDFENMTLEELREYREKIDEIILMLENE